MDTGAMTASLSAHDIERFQRDGEDWIRFRLAVKGADDTRYEMPLIGISQIKSRAEEADEIDLDGERRGSNGRLSACNCASATSYAKPR